MGGRDSDVKLTQDENKIALTVVKALFKPKSLTMLPVTEIRDFSTPFGQVLVIGYSETLILCKSIYDNKNTFYLPPEYIINWKSPIKANV
jgi:hypothetical protein